MLSGIGCCVSRSIESRVMKSFASSLADWNLDRDFHYRNSDRTPPNGVRACVSLANPSLLAACLFRLTASTSGLAHSFCRWLCLSVFASDISTGAVFEGAVEFPHPTGIVIGRGARVGSNVRIFQNVTIGSSRKGEYPAVGNGVTLYSGAVVAGDLVIGPGAVIGANCVVTRSVSGSDVIRSP
ncbi:hypothetical protein FCN77_20225 [Arthrobacter sp. 24S4-2]|uniref:serine O-acetyltransferase n=1 Tax=Arthrobacter sp. 24S4-2 TaxID=2575374 RepID=UPI0010C7CA58|nr:hypothetical protein FCN77_20225 [Arthrobacter sp. 24S4-2]